MKNRRVEKCKNSSKDGLVLIAKARYQVVKDAYLRAKLALRWWLFLIFYKPGGGGKEEITVSLTSYPPRFGYLHLTIKSILLQSYNKKRVVLWVAQEDFPKLPNQVVALVAYGLIINTCEDIKSYKKLVPELMEQQNQVIVTADDDIYYGQGWLNALVSEWKKDPLNIVCHRMHGIKFLRDGSIAPYAEWEFDDKNTCASENNFPTGMGGVLYPSNAFYSDVVLSERFIKLCPSGDDIWFYWMARLNGRKFKRVSNAQKLHCWGGSQDVGLWINNLHGEMNDVQIRNMIQAYGQVCISSKNK